MIIRDDLKNSDFYTKAMEVYKENTWNDINKQLFITIASMIAFGFLWYIQFTNNVETDETIVYMVAIFISMFAFMIYRFSKLKWEYDIYEIKVGKKWHTRTQNSSTYWVSEENEMWSGIKAYRVDDKSTYNSLAVGRTYIFLARKNILHEVVSIK